MDAPPPLCTTPEHSYFTQLPSTPCPVSHPLFFLLCVSSVKGHDGIHPFLSQTEDVGEEGLRKGYCDEGGQHMSHPELGPLHDVSDVYFRDSPVETLDRGRKFCDALDHLVRNLSAGCCAGDEEDVFLRILAIAGHLPCATHRLPVMDLCTRHLRGHVQALLDRPCAPAVAVVVVVICAHGALEQHGVSEADAATSAALLSLQEGVEELALRAASGGYTQEDVHRAGSLRGAESSVSAWQRRVPYGTRGTNAYYMLVEVEEELRGERSSARELLATLLHKVRDVRRAAEVLLHFAHPAYATGLQPFAPGHLCRSDAQLYLHRAAAGIPPPLAWEVLRRPAVALRAAEEGGVGGGVGGSGGAEDVSGRPSAASSTASRQAYMEARSALPHAARAAFIPPGRWFYLPLEARGFEVSRRRRTHGCTYTEAAEDGSDAETGEIFAVGQGGVPACPLDWFNARFGCVLAGGGVVWFTDAQETPQGLRLETVRHPSASTVQQLTEAAAAAGQPSPPEIREAVTASRGFARWDEHADEPTVVFCARSLHATLAGPPTDDLSARLDEAFEAIPGLCGGLMEYLEQRDVRLFHPASLLEVFQAMVRVSPIFHDKIFGSTGWLVAQAKAHPCIQLVSILGGAYERNIPIQPTDTVACLHHVALHEAKLGLHSGPLGILHCLNVVVRSDFDGEWSWVDGYRHGTYPSAFCVTGLHVELRHPVFANADVVAAAYEHNAFTFTLALRTPTAPTFTPAPPSHAAAALAGNATATAALAAVLPAAESQDALPLQRQVSASADNSIITVVLYNPTSGAAPDNVACTFFQGGVANQSRAVRVAPAQPSALGWGNKAVHSCHRHLQDLTTGWDASAFTGSSSATGLIEQVFTALPAADAPDPYETFLLDLWERASQRLVKAQQFKPADLDAWVLGSGPVHGLCSPALATFVGLRREAARRLVACYAQGRGLGWEAVPVSLQQLRHLHEAFPADMADFVSGVREAATELQTRVCERRVARAQVRAAARHASVLAQNGVSLGEAALLARFDAAFAELEGLARMLRVLIEKWCVGGDSTEVLATLEQTNRQRELVELCEIERRCAELAERLEPALEVSGAVSSPLLKAHFLAGVASTTGSVDLDCFADEFRHACAAVASLTLDTPACAAVAALHAPDARYTEGRREEERKLLAALFVDAEVAEALLEGALPLHFMLHDLSAFRRLVRDPPTEELRLHDGFFDGEEDVLLQLELSTLNLRETVAKREEVLRLSHGCRHKVMKVVTTMLQCGSLVKFTRDNPEAQDAGLSSVLSNSRDMQHACFQTFLDCTSYVNPFVAASQRHVDMYVEQRRRIEENDGEPGVLLRPPLNNSSSWASGDGGGGGFWEALSDGFGDTSFQNIAAIQEMLLKTSVDDKIQELETMIKEQNGTTDRLIAACRRITGLPEDDEQPGGSAHPHHPHHHQSATLVIEFPPAGQPALACVCDSARRTGGEYRDLVYRATLQRELSPALGTFVAQAREVLRAFNAACKVFAEGHLEFRSRKLSFHHNEAARVAALLQALQGQWSAGGDGSHQHRRSVFLEACATYPELACVTPAELVCMAQLMRKVSSVGDVTLEEAVRMTLPWRRGRAAWPGARAARRSTAAVVPAPTRCVAPPPSTASPAALPEDDADEGAAAASAPPLLALSGAGAADGEYRRGLWTYRQAGGESVLCPANGGWVVYQDVKMSAAPLLSSAATHRDRTPPWRMGDWLQRAGGGDKAAASRVCLALTVQEDAQHYRNQAWSAHTRGQEQSIGVIGTEGVEGLSLVCGPMVGFYPAEAADAATADAAADEEGDHLWVESVSDDVEGALWDSMGFEAGMRVVAVDNERGPADAMREQLHDAASQGRHFSVTVAGAWTWFLCGTPPAPSGSRTPAPVRLAAGGRAAVKACARDGCVVVSPACGATWRVRVSGNVEGMRVGACGAGSGEDDEHTFWYCRDGMLRHGGRAVCAVKPFRAGDVVTVHVRGGGDGGASVEFHLNGRRIAGDEGVLHHARDCGRLHPAAFLRQTTASVELSPGRPAEDVAGWSAVRASSLIAVDSARALRTQGTAGAFAGVLGDEVFRGPGPHIFSAQLVGQSVADCLVGVAPPAIFLDKQYSNTTALCGLTIRPDGNVFGLKEGRILHTPKRRVQFASGDTITFVVDLGAGTLEVLKNGERVLHTGSVEELPRLSSPLVPYCALPTCDVECRIVPTPESREPSPVAAAVVKLVPGLSGVPAEAAEGAAAPAASGRRRATSVASASGDDHSSVVGVYEPHVPTYVRADGRFVMYHWVGRWCVCDRAEHPVAWSDPCSGEEPLGTTARRWTLAADYAFVPPTVLLRVPGGPPVVFHLQQPRAAKAEDAVYRSAGAPALRMFRDAAAGCWAVAEEGGAGHHLYISLETGADLPHHSVAWAWGDGERWRQDSRIRVVRGGQADESSDEETDDEDSGATAASASPPGAAAAAAAARVEAVAAVSQGTVVRVIGEARSSAAALDSMTPDELAGWHIIHNATGTRCSAPQLRVLLQQAARGSASGVELLLNYQGPAEALEATRAAAAAQLTRIGQLLKQLRRGGGDGSDVLAASNYDPAEPKWGLLQSKTITGNVVDVSRLSPSDRRVFGLSLFKGRLLPYHVLDCDANTPPEDVRAFIVLYRLLPRGRLVLFNLQELGPDLQNEVTRTAAEPHADKQLIAIVTEGGRAAEPADPVDNAACDVRWRRWAHARVALLRRLDSITYFDQPTGTGKSHQIERMIREGRWDGLTPTYLDLDSTKATTEAVCERLLAPLRAARGLLVVHVAHDASLPLVNKVLDGLAILGRISSPSGLTVVTPPSGWHLVVELQEGPPADPAAAPGQQQQQQAEYPVWRKPGGGSDVTLLACRGLAEQGALAPYDTGVVERGAEALAFLTQTLEGLPRDPETALRAVASGWGEERWPADAEAQEEARRELAGVPAHVLTRALRFAARVLPKGSGGGSGATCLAEKEMRRLEALAMAHEMRHFVSPSHLDHFHLKVFEAGPSRRVTMAQLSGETPPAIQQAVDEWKQAVDKFSALSPGVLRFEADTPLFKLTEVLTDELHVNYIKTCASKLAEKNYVLIPDFLQKLIQLNSRVELLDPVILQGPSGTGKSYAITMLADLLQLPSKGTRKGFADIAPVLITFLRNDPSIKKMFPNNVSDQVGGVERVMWKAEVTDTVKECLALLLEGKALAGLQLVATTLASSLGPRIKEVAEGLKKSSASAPSTSPATPAAAAVAAEQERVFQQALDFIIGGDVLKVRPSDPSACKEVHASIEQVTKGVMKIGGGVMNLQIQQCVEGCLRSGAMKELMGSDFAVLQKMLTRKPRLEAALAWAKEAVRRAGSNGAALVQLVRDHMTRQIKASPLLLPSPELLRALAMGDGPSGPCGEELSHVIDMYLQMQRKKSSLCILMRYYMTPEMLFAEMCPLLETAEQCSEVTFIVLLDEMNATHMLGLLKRIVIDRRWDMWAHHRPASQGVLPHNIAFIGAINPAKKEAVLEGFAEAEAEAEMLTSPKAGFGGEDTDDVLGFDVTPMPPSLTGHIIPWQQLAKKQRELFIARLIGANKTLFKHAVPHNMVSLLGRLLLAAHRTVQRISMRKRSTVSQRDVHRAMTVFDFFFQRGREFIGSTTASVDVWDLALSSMILGIATSYCYRLSLDDRAFLSAELTQLIASAAAAMQDVRPLPEGTTFESVVQAAVDYYCGPHLTLPDAVYAHNGLRENLFVQMVCFENRIAVVLHGPPGTSKTLSNNIIRDNMAGRGDFWNQMCTISEVCRYQGSAQSSADEIKKKCEEAHQGQKKHDAHGHSNKRCLLFVDEAGLIKGEGAGRKWALKVLHYYLEGCNIASVLMTNQALDPAIGNRCVEVYMAKPRADELSNMCAGILHNDGVHGLSELARRIVPACCEAFHTLLASGSPKYRWWYGLRDLFHLMRYLRRHQPDPPPASAAAAASVSALAAAAAPIQVEPATMARALQRNFNGQPEMFARVLRVFSDALSAVDPSFSLEKLEAHLLPKVALLVDSIEDNNRATEGASGKNLNDMWVRFKLLVDNTDDGCALQMLRQSGVRQLDQAQVFSLSALSSGDDLMPVTVVSQITAAMETGKTVWLTNTRAIDACLFDVFNQSYVVASNGKGETLHFVAVAIGATLEYKRVHKNFQCIVHVTQRELAEAEAALPAPYLNRLEKFTVSAHEVLEHALARLPHDEQREAEGVRRRLDDFLQALSGPSKCLYSDSPSDTLDSLVLEAVQTGRLVAPPLPKRVAADAAALGHFFYEKDGGATGDAPGAVSCWRGLSVRLLQLLQPEGVLLAQRVLRYDAPAYLRTYFRGLDPWRLTGYLRQLRDEMVEADAGDGVARPEPLWRRSTVFTPANVDFASLLSEVDGCVAVSCAGLLSSESGQDDFEEALYRFAVDPAARVLAVLLEPESLGRPQCGELRCILDTPPVLEDGALRGSKAVVLLQCLPAGAAATQCTPLFGAGWDMLYIDAAAERVGTELLLYADRAVVGALPPRPTPEWGDMEAVLNQAVSALMQSQAEVDARWVRVGDGDAAAALYQPKTAFGEQVSCAAQLLGRCPHLKKALLQLHRGRLPTAQGLVTMAEEVVQRQQDAAGGGSGGGGGGGGLGLGGGVGGAGSGASLAQRLVEEANKAPRALLALALRHLLDDRGASVVLREEPTEEADVAKLQACDRMASMAVRLAASGMTFDQLRWMSGRSLPPMFVGAGVPALPGSLALLQLLEVPRCAGDVEEEARRLEAQHASGSVCDMVEVVHADAAYVLDFFSDCVRVLVRHHDEAVVRRATAWTLQAARCLHATVFAAAEETVWSVRALTCVRAAELEAYVLAFMPLATGALEGLDPAKFLNPRDGARDLDWIRHELCPDLLVKVYPRVCLLAAGGGGAGSGNGSVNTASGATDVEKNAQAAVAATPAEAAAAAAAQACGVDQYVATCSALLHRASPQRAASSRSLPALSVAARLLSAGGGEASAETLKEVGDFLNACGDPAQGPPRLDPEALRSAVASVPAARAAVALDVVQYAAASTQAPSAGILSFLLEAASDPAMPRGLACRVLSGVVPSLEEYDERVVAGLLVVARKRQETPLDSGGHVDPCADGGAAAADDDDDGSGAVRYFPPSPEPMAHPLLGTAVYTALFDASYDQVVGLNCELLEERGAVGAARLRQRCAARAAAAVASEAPDEALTLYRAVQLCAAEQGFLRALARTFQRPHEIREVSWEPAALGADPEGFAEVAVVARALTEPVGFVAPPRGSEEDRELIKAPPDAYTEGNLLTLISALEGGTGTAQGMGTKATLEYLRDQVSSVEEGGVAEGGALVRVCGEAMRHKCQNAEPLATRPGDLPFVYKIDDPLYDPFLSLRRVLQVGADEEGASADAAVEAVATKVETLLEGGLSATHARLLLFYCGFRCFFGVRERHAAAREVAESERIAAALDLSAKQQRLLLVALDREACGSFAQGDVGVVQPLLEGFDNEWTQMMCATASVAAAMPGSFLHTQLLEVDAQRGSFLPGDKTGGPIAHGGTYKFDCVTQLDTAGNLDSYAQKQPVLSTGACYLLWGIVFGALTLQLTLFPEAHTTLWEWYFSSTIQARDFGYKRAMTDYQLMVCSLTERSMAYHLHMGAHTGLSRDEAQRMYANFVYHLATGPEEETKDLLRKVSTTREEAMRAEHVVEAFWRAHTAAEQTALACPQTDMCHTLKALATWTAEARPVLLPRSAAVLRQLDCLGGAEKPLLVDSAVHEAVKLALLPTLLLSLVRFSHTVHRALSGRLELEESGAMTAYLPVLELLARHASAAQVAEAREELQRIKRTWNNFRARVGPIDFECQEGGINIAMQEGNTVVAGSPGLPDTLDFWVTYSGNPDPAHKNLIKAAIISLTDKVCNHLHQHQRETQAIATKPPLSTTSVKISCRSFSR